MVCPIMGTQTIPTTGQRRDSRLRLALPARMVTLGGYSSVLLADLSQSGARVQLHEGEVLKPGAQGMLSWLGYEAFGAVVWCRYGFAGMEFDELLPADILLDTRERVDRGLALSEQQLDYLKAREWFEQHG